MKKGTIAALACILVMALCVTSAYSQVASTSKKGSLLMFPKIEVDKGVTTLIELSNDCSSTVHLRCFWNDAADNSNDFTLELHGNQVLAFDAATGFTSNWDDSSAEPFEGQGELVCWAINAAGDKISWNHLSGKATIKDKEGYQAAGYNAWAFAARAAKGAVVGQPGSLNLNQTEYDACPLYLTTSFPTGYAGGSNLALMPCKMNFVQDRNPIIFKAAFNLWKDNALSAGSPGNTYKCFQTHFDYNLDATMNSPEPLKGIGGEKFENLGFFGRYRVQGVASATECKPAAIATPLVGVAVDTYMGLVSATNLTGAGADNSGVIYYGPDITTVEAIH